MHELAIVQNIIGIIDSEAEKNSFARVVEIRLAVGEVSGVIPQCLSDFFPIASKGTLAEGAKLVSNVLPVTVRCNTCGAEGKPQNAKCFSCGSSDYKLVSGREFYVDSIEVE